MTQANIQICAKNESINIYSTGNSVFTNYGENVQIELFVGDAEYLMYQLSELVCDIPIEKMECKIDELEDERDTLKSENENLKQELESLREYIQDIRRSRNVG